MTSNAKKEDPRAIFFAFAKTGFPFSGASGAFNTYLVEFLRRTGYHVDEFTGRSDFVPLQCIEIMEQLTPKRRTDLAVYCDLAQWVEPLELVNAKRQIVFFHGLAGAPLVWLNRDIDVLCGNSRWTRDVLRCIGGFPLWKTKTLMCSNIFRRTHHVVCPVPALEHPEGAISGEGLSSKEWESLAESGVVYGLDFFGEADNSLHCHIIAAVNQVARQSGDRRQFRLIAPMDKCISVERDITDAQTDRGRRIRDILQDIEMTITGLYSPISEKWINQSDLFRLMRQSAFALAFNTIPESFGLMPLECILNGCVVYTNGSGNIRHLLPPDHGITVFDTEGIASSETAEIQCIARSIYSSIGNSTGLSRAMAEIECGRTLIRSRYSVLAFENSCAELLNRKQNQTLTDRDLVLAPGPLVRAWNRESGTILSDIGTVQLSQEQCSRIRPLFGRSPADLFETGDRPDQLLVSELWKKGLLAWDTRTSSFPV